MTGLQKKVYHDCAKPEVPDRNAEYKWICPDCQSDWSWWPQRHYTRYERYGFLWRKKREIPYESTFGGWSCNHPKWEWKEVTA